MAPDLDARDGRVAPSARQRDLASGLQVTWNRFGTPHAVASRSGYLATGLSSDNATAARQWIARNRSLLGIGATGLEVVTATDHAVLLRQTFDGVPAGRDGLISVGVSNGRVAYVSSSLAPDTNITGARDMGAGAAVREAARDADMTAGTVGNARERRGWTVLDASGLDRPAQARLVAVPTPRDGVRLAWETSLLEGDDGVASFVDAETGEVLVREGLVDFLADNPTWRVFPNSPPQNYASTDTRVRWCWLATTNCQLVLNNPASPMWDLDARTNTPTFTTRGNNAIAVHNWNSNDSCAVGTEPATAKPDREYLYPWTNQWQTQRCNPAVFDVAAAQRHRRGAGEPVRDAQPDARLGLRARLHRGHLEPAVVQLQPRRGGERPRARQRPGRRPQRRPARLRGARQRQPVHAGRRPAADHEHVPLAADRGGLLRPVRGRRLRHVGDRPRVRPRDLQPHGGRAERGPVGQPAPGHGRELVGPDGDRVPARERLHAGRRREPVRGRSVRDRRQGGRHPQLRDEQQPAQLLRRRLRLRLQRRQLHAADAGPRRRRDLERDQLRHPAGVHRPLRRHGRAPLDAARVRRLAADGDREREHDRRPQRDPGRRPAAQQRRQPGHHVERVRQARLRPGGEQQRRRGLRPGAGVRLAVRRRGDGALHGRPATRPARRPSCSWASTRRARTRSPTPTRARR